MAFIISTAAHAAVTLPEELVEGSMIYDEDEDKYLSPGMVTVIRPDEKSGEQRTLPDLLEEVPGLRVIRLRGRNGYAVASVRGSTSSQVAVYVDGILMNLQSEAAVDLSAIPVDNVEKIEVYRGYIPTRFGAQAMGGVINVVTKSPQKPEMNLSLGIGSFGRYKGSLSYSNEMWNGKFFGSFGYETYDGDFEYWNDNATAYNYTDDYKGRRQGNGFENMDLLLKWQDDHWRARASWVRRNRDLALIGPTLDKPWEAPRPWPIQDTDRWDFSLSRTQISGPVEWSVELMYTAQERYYNSRRGGAASLIGHGDVDESEYDAAKLGVSINANMPIGERHLLEFLAEYSDESLKVDGDMAFKYLGGISDYSQTGWDINLQDTIALDRMATFLATPSIRWHSIDGEDHFTWQIALTKEFSPNLMLKSAYGTYARAPNLYEKYGDGAFIIEPMDDLRWETGTQFDLGIIWNGTAFGGARANASLSGFWRETDYLIELLMEGQRFARYANIADSEVKGVELETGLDWDKWNLSLSATWMEGINKSPAEGSSRFYGNALPNRPEWSGTARLTRKFERASAFIEYQYVGENYADREETVLFNARNLFNIGVKYDLSPTSQLAFGVDDVFNDADGWRMHPSGGLDGPTRVLWYPIEGRTYYMTLNMRF
ncbi:MAG: TonB-dependent receptor [Synergistaceae bacterium]|nr:TonB-dependent receptor [Synergistaceae bacterium]